MTKQCDVPPPLARDEKSSTQCVSLSRSSTLSSSVLASSCHIATPLPSDIGGAGSFGFFIATVSSNGMPRSPRKKHSTSCAVLEQTLAQLSKSHGSGCSFLQ